MLNVSIVHILNTRWLQLHFKQKLWHLWVDFRFCYGRGNESQKIEEQINLEKNSVFSLEVLRWWSLPPAFCPFLHRCLPDVPCPQGFTSSIGQDKYKCWQTSDTNTKTDKYNMRKSNCGDNINATNESFLNVIFRQVATRHFLLCRCWHLGSTLDVNTYQKRYCFGRCQQLTQRLPKEILLW